MAIEIRNYKENIVGKDYIVGDIHGEYRKLKIILEQIGFNFSHDRLFSVGDLCDRGAHSEDLLEWMKYEWFIPVMGNHEVMILNHFYGNLDVDYMKKLKAHWFLDLKDSEKEKIVHYFNSLPIAIEIEQKNQKIGIVHAMCPVDSWDTFKKIIYSNTSEKMQIVNEAMWSFLAETKIKYVKNIDYIFVGHNVVPCMTLQENTYLIDTGSGYKTGKLTIIDLQTLKIANH